MALKDLFSGFTDELGEAKKDLVDLERQFQSLTSISLNFGREFSDSIKSVKNLTKEFEKGKDVSKQVNRELRQTRASLYIS